MVQTFIKQEMDSVTQLPLVMKSMYSLALMARQRVSITVAPQVLVSTQHALCKSQLTRASGSGLFFGPSVCKPDYTVNHVQCVSRNIKCRGVLKWVGKGCRSKKRKIAGDGGCQCRGYCGYTCRGACNKDKECVWATARNACYVKATGQPGGPIASC